MESLSIQDVDIAVFSISFTSILDYIYYKL